jgi:hypothetical protein
MKSIPHDIENGFRPRQNAHNTCVSFDIGKLNDYPWLGRGYLLIVKFDMLFTHIIAMNHWSCIKVYELPKWQYGNKL